MHFFSVSDRDVLDFGERDGLVIKPAAQQVNSVIRNAKFFRLKIEGRHGGYFLKKIFDGFELSESEGQINN